jgi:hypothetical protein
MQCLTNTSRKRAGPIAPSLFGFKRDDSISVLKLVSSVIESHTIGRRLSPDSYLRCSHMKCKQSLYTEGPKVWPQLEQLSLHSNGTVLVDCEEKMSGILGRCLYIVDGSYEATDVVHLVDRMSYEGAYYSAIPLCPSHDPTECLAYINRPIDHSRYWKTEKDRESFHPWISALQELISTGSILHSSSCFPILLLSSDEEASDDDSIETTQITVAWKEDS